MPTMRNVVEFKPLSVLPDRIREARQSLELSMTDLATKVGISRQAISLYEDGQREPEPEILIRIVQALQQPISYFTSQRPQTFGARGTRFFRAFKSKTKRTNTRCEVLSDWFAQTASYFAEFVKLPSVMLPEIPPPSNGWSYSSSEIEEAATLCRRCWGLGDGPIANVVALFESNGIVIARSELGRKTVDAFSFWEGERPFIFLGADRDSACRSRYDACHELGHLLLHRSITATKLEGDLRRVESEANHFASAFLLPEKTYPLEVFSSRLAALIHLKRRWKVSAAAQVYRCSELEIFDENQVLNLRKQLSAKGWRVREPLDDQLELETPTVMEKSLRLILNRKVQTVADVLSGIRLAPSAIEALLGVQLPPDNSDYASPPSITLRRS